MTPELKQRWAAALESGEYVQGRERLRTCENHMCCLGVLCDIVDPAKWRKRDFGWLWGGSKGMPPIELLDRIGLPDVTAEDLADKNDNDISFAEIAKIVRQLPEET